MNIDWDPPQPRREWIGEYDKVVGPGQTGAEFWLILIPSVVAALAMAAGAHFLGLNWNLPRYAIAMLMAFDLTGGVICNATNAAKRWYHRPGRARFSTSVLLQCISGISSWWRGCFGAWIGCTLPFFQPSCSDVAW
jgi:hypothetical protein